ncbi:MAG: hypothetical protein IPK11_13895 [Ignavibacteria bacterium]|nr:hypothetical protein [Ignavibacteria bacterium]
MNASTTVLAHNDILFAEQDSTLFSLKGESICIVPENHQAGRSAIANGGGGGNAHNAGGGGGSNGGCGGSGGYGWKEIVANKENAQGLGGYTLEAKDGKLFMGGGGGAGQGNDNTATDGGNGGGIIYIVAGHIKTNKNGSILAEGASATMLDLTMVQVVVVVVEVFILVHQLYKENYMFLEWWKWRQCYDASRRSPEEEEVVVSSLFVINNLQILLHLLRRFSRRNE